MTYIDILEKAIKDVDKTILDISLKMVEHDRSDTCWHELSRVGLVIYKTKDLMEQELDNITKER